MRFQTGPPASGRALEQSTERGECRWRHRRITRCLPVTTSACFRGARLRCGGALSIYPLQSPASPREALTTARRLFAPRLKRFGIAVRAAIAQIMTCHSPGGGVDRARSCPFVHRDSLRITVLAAYHCAVPQAEVLPIRFSGRRREAHWCHQGDSAQSTITVVRSYPIRPPRQATNRSDVRRHVAGVRRSQPAISASSSRPTALLPLAASTASVAVAAGIRWRRLSTPIVGLVRAQDYRAPDGELAGAGPAVK